MHINNLPARLKRIPWFELLLTAAILSISIHAALSDGQNLSLRWFTRDDAFYYYKVAQNISEGNGSTFDGINPTNGYHPLWMLVCVPIFALARFDLVLPLRILLIVLSMFSAATGILLYRILGRVAHPAIGALAAIYWVFDYQNFNRVYKPGLETGIAAFFILLLVYALLKLEENWRTHAATKKQLITLGIVAVFAMFSRLDLMFLAGMLGLWVVFRKQTLRYLLPLDLAAAVVAVLLAFILRLSVREYYRYEEAALLMSAISVVASIVGAYFLGLYRRDVLQKPLQLAGRLVLLAGAVSALAGVFMLHLTPLMDLEGFPRAVIPLHAALIFLLFGIPRFAYLSLRTGDAPQAESSPLELLKKNWRGWLADGVAYYGVVLGALGAYMLINKIFFGSFSPVSGQIKRWWGSFPTLVYGGTVRNPFAFFGLEYTGHSNAWQPVSTLLGVWSEKAKETLGYDANQIYFSLLAALGILFYLVLLSNKRKAKNAILRLGMPALFSAAVLQILSYHAPGYAAYRDWYWVLHPLLVILALGWMAGLATHPLFKLRFVPQAAWVLVFILGLQSGLFLLRNIQGFMQYGRWTPDTPNSEIAYFLEQNTEPGSIIGMTGGGGAGYFIQDRTVVNMDGLINRYEYFQAVKAGTGGEFLLALGMDYALVNEDFITRQPYNGQFNPYMTSLDQYTHVFELFRYHAREP
jgi:hypothetical protein